MFLRLLLALPLLLIPNALHFGGTTSIAAGINMTNLLFLMALVAVPLLSPAGGPRLPGAGYIGPALIGLFLAYLLGFVIAQLTAPQSLMADLVYLKTALFYPLFYFLYRNCRLDLQGTRQLIIVIMVVAAVAGLEAIREGLDYGVLQDYSPTRRASGPFGRDYLSANRAGSFFAIFLPVFVAVALFCRGQKFWRLAALAGAGILAVAIMMTFSRQAYGIALLCLLLVALRRSFIAAGLVAILMVSTVDLLPDSVTQRVEETEQTDAVGAEELDTSTASRFDIWSGGWQMWNDHPGGVGLNRFKTYIGNYSGFTGYDAHDYYLLVLAETGPLGLAALLWLVWRLLAMSRMLTRAAATLDGESRALAVGFSLAVVAMVLGNVYSSPFLEGAVMVNFWALCGLVERYIALRAAASVPVEAVAVEIQPSPAPPRFPLAARAGIAGRTR